MPSKDRRVAARQGELSRRKRRATRGPSGIPANLEASGAAPAPSANGSVAVATREAPTPASSVAAPRHQPGAPAFSTRPAGRQRSFDRPLAYQYIGPELIRIGVLSGIAFAVIVTLGFLW